MWADDAARRGDPELAFLPERLAEALEIELHAAQCGDDHPHTDHMPYDEDDPDAVSLVEISRRVLARIGPILVAAVDKPTTYTVVERLK